jgi:predicted dehydrogenase/threonine dehydrogenase-like Zn-dependent dehydrogenase
LGKRSRRPDRSNSGRTSGLKQLIQNIGSGKSEVKDVPAPGVKHGSVLIRTAASLVSAGTERMVVDFAEKNLLEKARARPDLVRQTIDKARRDGVLNTIDAVVNRLDQPMALGYSIAGTVIAVGADVEGFRKGDRVAAAGASFAVHAEVVSIPRNLVVRLPETVDFDSAAFTTVGAIALHGFRLSGAKLGETVAVIGLGLLGQISVQLARAAGCRVLGFDLQDSRARLALRYGAEEALVDEEAFIAACAQRTGGRGVDAILIAADTKSDGPVSVAARVARDRAVVVSVGAVGTQLPRKDYFDKELEFRISRSYGPGRYDSSYEMEGRDYPIGFVRWTENRNMEAIVALLAERKLDAASMITHRLDVRDGARAYDLITGKTGEPFLGVVLRYPESGPLANRVEIKPNAAGDTTPSDIRLGMLGAGNFAKAVLLPAIQACGDVKFVGIAAGTGLSARHAGDKYSFAYCTTSSDEVLDDPNINTVVIATRHDLHAAQTIRALQAGKHVFVEKPVCLAQTELDEIDAVYRCATGQLLMAGFNRRFAPMSRKLREHFRGIRDPLLIHYRVNGGFIPTTEWVQRPEEGGGRLLSEGVHFIDWAVWLTGARPTSVHAVATPNGGRYSDDNVSAVVTFDDGSILQLLYSANGDRAAGKERIEVFGGGRTAILDDFSRLELTARGRRKVERRVLRSDKGHRAGWAAFADAIHAGKQSPIPYHEIIATMRATFAAVESLRSGLPIRLEGLQ